MRTMKATRSRRGAAAMAASITGLAASLASAQGVAVVRAGESAGADRQPSVKRFVIEADGARKTAKEAEASRFVIKTHDKTHDQADDAGSVDGRFVVRVDGEGAGAASGRRPTTVRFRAQPASAPTPPQPPRAERRILLGVTLGEVGAALRRQLDLDENEGVLVESVIGGLPAEEAGIERFDIIVRIDGTDITGTDTVRRVLARHGVGDQIEVEVLRQGETESFRVELELEAGDAGSSDDDRDEDTEVNGFRIRLDDGLKIDDDLEGNFRVLFNGAEAMSEEVQRGLERTLDALRRSLGSLDEDELGEEAFESAEDAIEQAIEDVSERLEALSKDQNLERLILDGENAIRLRGELGDRAQSIVRSLTRREREREREARASAEARQEALEERMKNQQRALREQQRALAERARERAREMEARLLREAGRGGAAGLGAVNERLGDLEERLDRIEGMLERVLDRLGGGDGHHGRE